MLYINGIAIAVIELKRSSVEVGDGVRQLITNQEEIFNKGFFSTVQLVFAGSDSQGLRYGTTGTPEQFFVEWKDEADVAENEANAAGALLDKPLAQMCNKERLLDLIRHFIIFDAGQKKVPRPHQFAGVKAAQERMRQREGGVIWHTQGSGKSILMVLIAKWLMEHDPDARMTLAAPTDTRLEVARAYAISKLSWIRQQQQKLINQARETRREFIERESHTLWGRRYLLSVVEQEAKPHVSIDHKRITLSVRPGSDHAKRVEVIHAWHKSLLHELIPPLVRKWEPKLGVQVAAYFLQRMKTKWGSCNHKAGHIRLNTELVKKPKDLVEYVIVHEMAHLLEPTHSDLFITILDEHYPSWREARAELNDLPLTAEVWKE